MLFQIDPMSRTPIYEQIISQLEKFIMTGVLSPGEQIPSVRSVSVELSVNPITVLKAYQELDSKELIHAVPGKGYFVSEGATDALAAEKTKLLGKIGELAYELAVAGVQRELAVEQINEAYKKAGAVSGAVPKGDREK